MAKEIVICIALLLTNTVLSERVRLDPVERIPGIIFNQIKDTVFIDKEYTIYSTIDLSSIFDTGKYDFFLGNASALGLLYEQALGDLITIRSRINTLVEYKYKVLSFTSSTGVEVLRGAERAVNRLNSIRKNNHQSFFDPELQEIYIDNSWSLKALDLIEEIDSMKRALAQMNKTSAQSTIKAALQTLHNNLMLASNITANLEEFNLAAWSWPVSQAIDIIVQNTSAHVPKLGHKGVTEAIKNTSNVIVNGHYIISLTLPVVKGEAWTTYKIAPMPAFISSGRFTTIQIQPQNEILVIKQESNEHFFTSRNEIEACIQLPYENMCRAPAETINELDCESGLLREPSYSYMTKCKQLIRRAQKLQTIRTSKPGLWVITTQVKTTISAFCADKYEEFQAIGTQFLTVPETCVAAIGTHSFVGGGQPNGPIKFVIPALDILSEAHLAEKTWLEFSNLMKICIIVILGWCGVFAAAWAIFRKEYTPSLPSEDGEYRRVEAMDAEITFSGPHAIYDTLPLRSREHKHTEPGYICPKPGCNENTTTNNREADAGQTAPTTNTCAATQPPASGTSYHETTI